MAARRKAKLPDRDPEKPHAGAQCWCCGAEADEERDTGCSCSVVECPTRPNHCTECCGSDHDDDADEDDEDEEDESGV